VTFPPTPIRLQSHSREVIHHSRFRPAGEVAQTTVEIRCQFAGSTLFEMQGARDFFLLGIANMPAMPALE
jgi:hypothetical protein